MATAVETVKNFMNVLTNYSQDTTQVGLIALDEAVRRVSYFSSLEEVAKNLIIMLGDKETYPESDTRLPRKRRESPLL